MILLKSVRVCLVAAVILVVTAVILSAGKGNGVFAGYKQTLFQYGVAENVEFAFC